ncbi:MAG: hypothetical protein NVS1B10_05320 [Candidatus Saccharimonadales bacterium]
MSERSVVGNYNVSIEQFQVVKVAEFNGASGLVGRDLKLESPEAEQAYVKQLAEHTLMLTKQNTASCGDGRRTLYMAEADPDDPILRNRVDPQLFGGLGLATTKALVAANHQLVKDCKTITQAYMKVSDYIFKQFNEEDGGHNGCGASKNVEASVANLLPNDFLKTGIRMFVPEKSSPDNLISINHQTKMDRLSSGFYGDWDPDDHIDYLNSHFPQNFSHLEINPDDHKTHGHYELGVYVTTKENMGFAKNAFIEDTDQQAFSVTLAKMYQMATLLSSTREEKSRILIGYADDTLNVGGGIVAEGMPVFTQAA